MVQQTDSKFSERVLANSETTFLKHDKNTSSRNFQNEKNSDENSHLKDIIPAIEANKVSGIKRPQQTPGSNKGNLVYVRRKTESEHHKNCNKANDQPIKLREQDQMNDSRICAEKDIKISSPSVTHDSENKKRLLQWEERYLRLQNFLKALDLSNQDDYRQMLQSMSSVGLSKVAVELEKRSLQLSMEEAREVQRAKLVDTLHKFPTTMENTSQQIETVNCASQPT